MTTAPRVWQETFKVRAYEVDARGTATIQTLCNYLQEAAGNHAHALELAVDQLQRKGMTWVLARLRVRMSAYPQWRDGIAIHTWPSDANRLYAFRDFEILDSAGQQIGTAVSAWILLDLNSRRPVRTPPEVTKLAVRGRPRAMADAFEDRLRPPEAAQNERHFVIRASDVDINRHVNLVNYIEWAVETVPAAVREQTSLRELQVEFHAESVYGDEAVSQSAEIAPRIFRHAVLRKSDLRALALVQTSWQ